MELTAYLLNNLFLFLYAILGGIDLGMGFVIVLLFLKKRSFDFVLKTFGYLWEWNLIFLVFFVTSFFCFFPKAMEATAPQFTGIIFFAMGWFLLRIISFFFLTHVNKKSLIALFTFFFSNILAVLSLSTYFVSLAKVFIQLNFLDSFFILSFCVISVFMLSLSFILFIKDKDLRLIPEKALLAKSFKYLLMTQITLSTILLLVFIPNVMFRYILIWFAGILLSIFLFFLKEKFYKYTFYIFAFILLLQFTAVIISRYPILLNDSAITAVNTFTTTSIFIALIISTGVCIMFSVPGVILFYNMFLKDQSNEY